MQNNLKPACEPQKKPYQKPGIASKIFFNDLVGMYIAIVGFCAPGKFPKRKISYSFLPPIITNYIVTIISILTSQNLKKRIFHPKIPELIISNPLR